jgi:hypothetical protein
VGCDLVLDDIKLANDKAASVRPRPSVDGRFELREVVFAGEVDIFTQWEYESPMDGTEWLGPGYGGSGWHMPSEGFAPQGEVQLFANVSYRGAGVANKPVAFTVEDPNGVVLSQRTTQSNAEGIAEAPFRIPTDAINGTWKATANVDIAGTVVEDYVEFEVDWIIKILSVEADKDTYAKGEALMFTITYKNLLTFHEVPVTFTIVVFDDYEYTKVPVARMTVTTTVQPGPGTEALNGMTIIPSWAFVGTARAYANAFNPENGAPYCTQQYAEFSIVRA